ncbi:MAG: c-type cytochrome [Bacteroidetes bacterium]|nr:c-type cytochrome [Bacteroidota bacterium]
MRHYKKSFLTLCLLVLSIFSTTTAFAQPDGAKLFKQNCATCHRLDDKKLTGPGLKGVADRVPKPADEWLFKWVKNNDKLRASGDAYANKVFNDFGGSAMTVFEYLSDDEIKAVIAYFKNPPVEVAPTAPVAGATSDATEKKSEGLNPTLPLIIIAVFLVILAAVLRGVKKSLKNVLNEKEGKGADADLTVWQELVLWMNANRTKVAVVILFLIGWGGKLAWDGMMGIGIYQGYKPEQPIAFSHKIHAGDNGINCVYCHSYVEKSRHAGIPSVNICMNCHQGIEKGPNTGTAEIAKIYAAAGWNTETQAYDKPQSPIKWIKVHNLPDFVYFSHQQHVVVGKQECTTCHGEVKEMTVAQQHAPLTMAWCVDCHRKTEVAMANNPYYEDLHKKLAEKYKGQKITVDKMGGIECAKCHY